MTQELHADELPIDAVLVQSLLGRQFPEYARRSLTRLAASGSTNVLFKLGGDLVVRLPRQPGGSASIEKEHRWLPRVGRALSVHVPEIVALGGPDGGFSERWSIARWIEGESATVFSAVDPRPVDRSRLAADLARVILELRAAELPEAAKLDPGLQLYRGGSLADFDERMQQILGACASIPDLDLDLEAARAIWREAMSLPARAGASGWFHGDLVAENLLIQEDRLVAVLDFGGLGVGDPSIDVHGAWELFDVDAREVFRGELGVEEEEWLRGRAWALAVALMTFPYYWSKLPGRVEARLVMVRSVLRDAIRRGA